MNDLYAWLSRQHHGLRTYRAFQQKLDILSGHDPDQRALCRLLGGIVSSYVENSTKSRCRLRSPTRRISACSIWSEAWIWPLAPIDGSLTSTASPPSIYGSSPGTLAGSALLQDLGSR